MKRIMVLNTTFLPNKGGIDNYINNIKLYSEYEIHILCFIKDRENIDIDEKVFSIYDYFKVPHKTRSILLRLDTINSLLFYFYCLFNRRSFENTLSIVRHPIFFPIIYFDKNVVFLIATILPDYLSAFLKNINIVRKVYLKMRIKFFRYAERKLIKNSKVFTLSENIKNEVIKFYGQYNLNEVRVSYPGINKEKFKFKHETISENKIKLVTVCRLSEEKNIQLIVEAVSKQKNLYLTIVGDGPTKKDLEDMVSELKINNRVNFIGFSSQVSKYLQDSHIFVMPSTYEGFGHVYLEAMACGKPCIALNKSFGYKVASNEIIYPNYNGELIDNTSNSLIEAINLIANMANYKEYCTNSYEFSKKYNWKNHISAIYKNVI